MKGLRYVSIIAALALGLTSVDAAAQMKKVAQTGLQFLKIDISPRVAAMGGAFSMVGNDATAMMYNPAGMVNVESFDVYAARTTWIDDISYSAAGAAKNFGGAWGTFGLSVRTADYGDVIGTRVSNNQQGFEETGQLNVGALAIGASYARRLSTRFSIGGRVSYASQRLGSNMIEGGGMEDNEVGGTAYDFGTIYYPGFRSLRIGMSLRNFSQQFQYVEDTFELPLTFYIGAAMDVLDLVGSPSGNSLTLAVDAIHPRDYTERVHVGGEFVFRDVLALRAGYKFNYDIESFSLGFGVRQDFGGWGVKADYAYSDLDLFGTANRFSLGASF